MIGARVIRSWSLAAALLAVLAAPGLATEIRAVDLGGLEARSAALLLSGQETGELEASFLARRLPPTETATPILLVADLPGGALLEGAGGDAILVEVYAYALDGGGQPRATLSRAFRIGLASHRSRLESGGVKFLGQLELPAGAAAASLRLLVLHRASGRFALSTVALEPPPPAGMAAPLVLEPADPWLVIRGPRAGELSPPDRWLPATRLLAGAGGSLTLGLTAGGSPEPAGRLLDPAGELRAELEVEPVPGPDGAGRVRVDLGPAAPGAYALEIASGGGGPATRVPLEVVSQATPAGTPWFRRTQPAAADVADVPDKPPPPVASDLARRALSAYHRAFEAWHDGDFAGAAAQLRRLEAGATYSGKSATLSIEEDQVRAASELVARDAEALVPLMCLHERLYRIYRDSDDPQLATHSRRLAGEFSRIYAERGGREARRLAALVVVSLAGAQQESGARNSALAAYERALEIDPRQPEALLGLAALHESFAHYETVVELLRRLSRTQRLPPAARLRLAVNLGRVGAKGQAEDHLRELIEARPEWVSRLAYQELARLLAGSQRAEEALALLAEGRQRYPGDQALVIQQAALLDRLGRSLAGQRVLAGIDEAAGDRGDSPRLRYSELPTAQIQRARQLLDRAAVERLATVLERSDAIQQGSSP